MEGVKALMKDLGMAADDTKALAEHCQASMQATLDEMYAAKDLAEGRAPAKKDT